MVTAVPTSDDIWLRLMQWGNIAGCHQMGSRSFFAGNYQFPVCARCTGVFIGQLVAIIVFILFRASLPLLWAFGFLAVMFADWLLQRIDVCPSTNLRRLTTGMLAGGAYATLLIKLATWAFARFL